MVPEARLCFRLDRDSMEAMCSYLLRYVRDSFAPVDHIDIEIGSSSGARAQVTLVVKRLIRTHRCRLKRHAER